MDIKWSIEELYEIGMPPQLAGRLLGWGAEHNGITADELVDALVEWAS